MPNEEVWPSKVHCRAVSYPCGKLLRNPPVSACWLLFATPRSYAMRHRPRPLRLLRHPLRRPIVKIRHIFPHSKGEPAMHRRTLAIYSIYRSIDRRHALAPRTVEHCGPVGGYCGLAECSGCAPDCSDAPAPVQGPAHGVRQWLSAIVLSCTQCHQMMTSSCCDPPPPRRGQTRLTAAAAWYCTATACHA